MLYRSALLGLAVAGLFIAAPVRHSLAGPPAGVSIRPVAFLVDDDDKKQMKNDGDKKDADDEKDDEHEGKEHKKEMEIEQAVPLNMVPQAILDAVKKEVPNGTITEAELEAKKGKIMYSFDVKDGTMAYDVKITVDGKFFSKKVDDDKDDEKDDKEEKPAMPAKK